MCLTFFQSCWEINPVVFEKITSCAVIHVLHSFLTAPDGPPNGVSGKAYNSTALSINFTSPDRTHRNGIILGYEVTLVNEIEEVKIATYPVEKFLYWNELGISSQVIFSGLREYFNHSVTVKAYTSKGLGPPSKPIILRTGEAGNNSLFFLFTLYAQWIVDSHM